MLNLEINIANTILDHVTKFGVFSLNINHLLIFFIKMCNLYFKHKKY
jgi:hypothetical protein